MLVIDRIKSEVSQYVVLQSKTGVFLSAFGKDGKLLLSHGVVRTNRTLEMILQSFYTAFLQKIEAQVATVILDIVQDVRLQNDPNVLMKLPLDQYWLFLVQDEWLKSWVLLPNTKGIDSPQQAFSAIKQKYNLGSQVSVYIFTTKKVEISF